jgi:hypothetical protein
MKEKAKGAVAVLIGLVLPVASIVMLVVRSLFIPAAVPAICLCASLILFLRAAHQESHNQGTMVFLVPVVAVLFSFAVILVVDIVSVFL